MSPIRLLSVEDDPDLQRLIELALADAEFEPHFAFTGPSGYEQAVKVRPDVILCDLMLPGYDGRELIRRLREDARTRDIPVVVVTAHYDSASFVESEVRKLGVIEYVRKPVHLGDLLVLVRRVVSAGAGRRRRAGEAPASG